MKFHGEITPPGDKSISHRAFMLGALATGTTVIRGALESMDIGSTREALRALGVAIKKDRYTWLITGGTLQEPVTVIDAGNSGTTARLLSGILASLAGVSVVTGDASLVNRPMARVLNPLECMGAHFIARQGGFLPMAIKGGSLRGISHDMEIASAQVKSALLLAGLHAHLLRCHA
jgi:3-phosphoshikimate 1-carboxyvinyltransferase